MEWLISQFSKHGLTYGDVCKIIPAGGHSRKQILNRTTWDILPEGQTNGLPVLGLPVSSSTFHYRLELSGEIKGAVKTFVFKTLSGPPILLNGQPVKEAFLEKKDVLHFPHGDRFEFDGPGQELTNDLLTQEIDIDQIAVLSVPILLQGETGTGKSHWAKLIHEKSGRRGNFIHLNVSSYSPALVESELFGHKKGSFTGAIQDKIGAIASAHCGTLFIDEVDSLSWDIQTKLLLFLDSQEFRPVGSAITEKVQTRTIFASGRSLKELVAKGPMRADFYFRLSQGLQIDLLPLRKRPERIKTFCEEYGQKNNLNLTTPLLDFYTTLPWPGNIRQLKGHLDLKRSLSKTGKLDFDKWDERLIASSSDLTRLEEEKIFVPMDTYKRKYAFETWSHCRGNLRRTCKILEIDPKTLRRLIDHRT